MKERYPGQKEFEEKHGYVDPKHVTDDDVSAMLTVPEVLPCTFDRTLGFWLERLSFWGKLNITHVHTKDKKFFLNKKTKMTKDDALDKMLNDEEIKSRGKWNFKKLSMKSVECYRNYFAEGGKKYKESIFIDIELDSQIARAVKGRI